MASDAVTSDKPPHQRKQNKQADPKRHRSIFELPPEFFDSCRLLQSPSSAVPDSEIHQVDTLEASDFDKEIVENNSNSDAKLMQRWSCNTCKAEFESLQDQRLHFKSDLHRFNIKLSIAGKNTIKEEDFDEETSESLCKDYDVSSISGSEDEDERDASLPSDRQPESVGLSRRKIFIQLKNGERISVWRCLLLAESEHILFESDKSLVMDASGDIYLTQREMMEKLKYILHEPRNNTCLRIVFLATGGHVAGCVFDGNSLIAHKTFHRYVVRAKAGKKQSSKDAGGRTIHSAGASLRRYNELGLKKDIQELLTLWKPHFAVASCIFIYAPSNNRQLFFDGDNPYFICNRQAIRNIPLTVRRPTLKEAKRIYNLLVQISFETSLEITSNTEEQLSSAQIKSDVPESSEMELRENLELKSSEMELRENLELTKSEETHSIVSEMDSLSLSVESKNENESVGTTTPLHEAAKAGNGEKVLELLEQGLDPCIKDERGQTPYMLASEKEVRNTFRRFMASNLEKWDWHTAKVPSPLTKEMEESQAAKQAEKDAKRKAKAKELKKLRKAKEKKEKAEAAQSQNSSSSATTHNGRPQSSGSAFISKEEEMRRIQEEREKRAAAAERRIAALNAASNSQLNNTSGNDILCSCCNASLAGKVPFHRYNYKYCSTSCMHVHREVLEDG